MSRGAEEWLVALKELGDGEPVRIMNVCGGHERSISIAGLRSLIPDHVELVPGPGCPVCICPEEDVYEAIQLALNEDVTLVAFGDMLRVPGSHSDLLAAKSRGAGSTKTTRAACCRRSEKSWRPCWPKRPSCWRRRATCAARPPGAPVS